ncbi:MAG: T9SS type A sorting domain-containing protein, partial [Ignavibacteria bacterium]
QWVSRYNGPGNNEDRAYAIVVDNSDNVIVTGGSVGSSTASDYETVKYNQAGVQQWESRYNGPGNSEDRAYAIVVDNSDNIIVTGESKGNGSDFDYGTVKYNQAGSQQWVGRYNGPGNSEDRAYAIVVDNSDNIYITGSSRSGSSQGTEDYATLEYTPAGSELWAVRYNGTGSNEDRAYAIVVDNSDNIFVTGESRNSSVLGSEDYLTVKYADTQLSGIRLVENSVPRNYEVYQNYPNPFNPSTKIRIDVAARSFVKVAVYDVLGNQKEVLVDQNLNTGTYEVEWKASGFSSGVYFYRITMDGFSITKKMLLIK